MRLITAHRAVCLAPTGRLVRLALRLGIVAPGPPRPRDGVRLVWLEWVIAALQLRLENGITDN